jgi:hypothetical protein
MFKCQHKEIRFGTQLLNGSQGRTGSLELFFCPIFQGSNAGEKRSCIKGFVGIPNVLRNFGVNLLETFLAAISDPKKGVQKTLNDRDQRKEIEPSFLGYCPTIYVHTLWLIIRV